MKLTDNDREEYVAQMTTILRDLLLVEESLGKFTAKHNLSNELGEDISIDQLSNLVHKIEYFIHNQK